MLTVNQEWINVYNELPEKGDNCWIHTAEGEILMDLFDGDYWVNQTYDSITHWMPVIKPEPPEIVKDDGKKYCIKQKVFFASFYPIIATDLNKFDAHELSRKLNKEEQDNYTWYEVCEMKKD